MYHKSQEKETSLNVPGFLKSCSSCLFSGLGKNRTEPAKYDGRCICTILYLAKQLLIKKYREV